MWISDDFCQLGKKLRTLSRSVLGLVTGFISWKVLLNQPQNGRSESLWILHDFLRTGIIFKKDNFPRVNKQDNMPYLIKSNCTCHELRHWHCISRQARGCQVRLNVSLGQPQILCHIIKQSGSNQSGRCDNQYQIR